MDNLDWSNQEHELEESLIMPSSNINGILYNCSNTEMQTKDGLINNPQQIIPKTDAIFSNVFQEWSSRSGPVTSWGAAINGDIQMLHSNSIQDNNHINNDQQNGLNTVLDSGLEKIKPVISANTGSLESLDCLLSASDTTSIEDDGVSWWNFTTSLSDHNYTKLPGFDDKNHHDGPGPNPTEKRRSSTEPDFVDSTTIQENPKKPRSENHLISSSNINFQQPTSSASTCSGPDEPDAEAIAQMKEMIYRAAAFRPVNFGLETVEKPKRKNVRISNDPQTVAARQRRERISERIRALQRLVPGGSKMDTASMLDEAANYLKFLRSQVKALEALGPKINKDQNFGPVNANLAFSVPFVNYSFAMQQPPPLFSTQNHNPANQTRS